MHVYTSTDIEESFYCFPNNSFASEAGDFTFGWPLDAETIPQDMPAE